jgi:hypothetical protein
VSSRSIAFAVALAAALAAGCGSSATEAETPGGGTPGPCVPACSGRQCGPDGCGGTCGACAEGTLCGASGSCVAPQLSLSCPAGQRCTVLERTAYLYACAAPGQCVRGDSIGTFGTYEGCRSLGCSGGNSSCGEQFGRNDPVVWACLACVEACSSTNTTVCPLETADGCVYGDATIPCVCQ